MEAAPHVWGSRSLAAGRRGGFIPGPRRQELYPSLRIRKPVRAHDFIIDTVPLSPGAQLPPVIE
jgi:hypothetical protein